MRSMADKPQHPPTIELDGARLRPLRVADAAALYAYLRDPVVTELTSYPVASAPVVEAMIERSLSRWAAGELSSRRFPPRLVRSRSVRMSSRPVR